MMSSRSIRSVCFTAFLLAAAVVAVNTHAVHGASSMKTSGNSTLSLLKNLRSAAPKYPPVSVGDVLVRDYTKYDTMPITASDAASAGWTAMNGGACNAHKGIEFAQSSSGPSTSKPLTLYFTPAGDVAGISVLIEGSVEQKLVDAGFYKQVGDKKYTLTVTFRDQTSVCSASSSDLPLGDRLIINADTIAYPVPLTSAEAEANGWTAGSCFSDMGYHWFYDLESAPKLSWKAENLLPIVPMYNNGQINAFFFASSVVQQSLLNANQWDPIPLINLLMCKNFCDSSCTFSGTIAWSTMHIFLSSTYKQASCPGGCTIGCCPK